jgi:uncharacterized protein
MKPLGIAATLGFAFAALLLGTAAGWLAMGFTVVGARLTAAVDNDGALIAAFTLANAPVQAATVAFAARRTGEGWLAYLALDVLPRGRAVAIAAAGLALLIAAADGLDFALRGAFVFQRFELDIHRSALAEGALLPLWIAILAAAPVSEEIVFRGFLFRGLVRKPHHALPGIIAISIAFAALHIQYDWIGVSTIFAFSLLLGFVRLVSGSTLLTILLHMLWNLESEAEVAAGMGWV